MDLGVHRSNVRVRAEDVSFEEEKKLLCKETLGISKATRQKDINEQRQTKVMGNHQMKDMRKEAAFRNAIVEQKDTLASDADWALVVALVFVEKTLWCCSKKISEKNGLSVDCGVGLLAVVLKSWSFG